MLRSRIASTATRSCRSLLSVHYQAQHQASSVEPSAWPAVPSGNPEETKEKYEPHPFKPPTEPQKEEDCKPRSVTEPLATSKPPHVPSPRLEKIGVHNPAEPSVQQKRVNSTMRGKEIDPARIPSEQEQDNIDYYKHRKPSPLSEVEFADTRKPLARETDSEHRVTVSEVTGWRPEQLDTAEEALERARRIWGENAIRGDPDSPHGRVLRTLRGEWF